MRTIKVYETVDGRRFDTIEEALEWEEVVGQNPTKEHEIEEIKREVDRLSVLVRTIERHACAYFIGVPRGSEYVLLRYALDHELCTLAELQGGTPQADPLLQTDDSGDTVLHTLFFRRAHPLRFRNSKQGSLDLVPDEAYPIPE